MVAPLQVTIEEREEYEQHIKMGTVVYAGGARLQRAVQPLPGQPGCQPGLACMAHAAAVQRTLQERRGLLRLLVPRPRSAHNCAAPCCQASTTRQSCGRQRRRQTWCSGTVGAPHICPTVLPGKAGPKASHAVVWMHTHRAACSGLPRRCLLVHAGGNNDTPFFKPDLFVCVTDPHRVGHEERFHPGDVCFRQARAGALVPAATSGMRTLRCSASVQNIGQKSNAPLDVSLHHLRLHPTLMAPLLQDGGCNRHQQGKHGPSRVH